MGIFHSHGGTPSHHPAIRLGFSMKSTIQLLGYPHDYGNLQMGLYIYSNHIDHYQPTLTIINHYKTENPTKSFITH